MPACSYNGVQIPDALTHVDICLEANKYIKNKGKPFPAPCLVRVKDPLLLVFQPPPTTSEGA